MDPETTNGDALPGTAAIGPAEAGRDQDGITGDPIRSPENLKPDPDAALAFLRLYSPEHPWDLIAFPVEGGGPRCKRFEPDQADEAAAWLIKQYESGCNLYFHVNPNSAPDRKAKKGDVTEVRYLHVDCDPHDDDGESWDDAQERITKALLEELPHGVHQPTFVTNSGNGYWGFWNLDPVIKLDGSEECAEEAERYNRALETAFEGDNCHNVDRVARLPGFPNRPNEKKRTLGRTTQMASLIKHWPDNTYPPAAMSKALPKDQVGAKPGAGAAVDARPIEQADIPVLTGIDVAEIKKWGASGAACARLLIGYDPDKHNSPEAAAGRNKSDDTMFIACQLCRDGLSDAQIAGILSNPDWAGNAHIFKKGGDSSLKYITQQVTNARKKVGYPDEGGGGSLLDEMNERYFAIHDEGGKARIGYFTNVPRIGMKLTTQTHDDFKKRFGNKRVNIGNKEEPKYIDQGGWWLLQKGRREYERVEFAPEIELPPNILNLWRGFAVRPVEGELPILIEHLRSAGGDDEGFAYLWNWLAWVVQNPGEPPEVALVFQGGKGTGKSTVGHLVRSLFSPHAIGVSQSSQLTGKFNGHFRDCRLVFADEAVRANDRDAESQLKTMITEKLLAIEPKGLGIIQVPNRIALIMATNEEWAIPATLDERRFAVFTVDDRRTPDFWDRLYAEIDPGVFLKLLLDTELPAEWHPRRNVPQNAALANQKRASLDPIQDAVLTALLTGAWPDHCLGVSTGSELILSTADFCRDMRGSLGSNTTRLGHFFKKLGITKTERHRAPITDARGHKHERRGYPIPPLGEMRDTFNRVTGLGIEWDDAASWVLPGEIKNGMAGSGDVEPLI